MSTRAQIVASIGPASESPDVLEAMLRGGVDVARLNFAWLDRETGARRIDLIRSAAKMLGRATPIIADLPGARIQEGATHTYDASQPFSITETDDDTLALCVEKGIEYVALSFVGGASDIELFRARINELGGSQKIIAKIERKVAVDRIDEIIVAADAIMIARGDLGSEVPLEDIPFIQKTIIEKANAVGKPVITATQMLTSMTKSPEPTRAEVSDIEEAILEGSDAVMLSEESAFGEYPREAVAMMERSLMAAEKHSTHNPLSL
jgi:pyruvate kinase